MSLPNDSLGGPYVPPSTSCRRWLEDLLPELSLSDPLLLNVPNVPLTYIQFRMFLDVNNMAGSGIR